LEDAADSIDPELGARVRDSVHRAQHHLLSIQSEDGH
jgi:hypothetical protein